VNIPAQVDCDADDNAVFVGKRGLCYRDLNVNVPVDVSCDLDNNAVSVL
jgi:hypothetical protein